MSEEEKKQHKMSEHTLNLGGDGRETSLFDGIDLSAENQKTFMLISSANAPLCVCALHIQFVWPAEILSIRLNYNLHDATFLCTAIAGTASVCMNLKISWETSSHRIYHSRNYLKIEISSLIDTAHVSRARSGGLNTPQNDIIYNNHETCG